MRREWGAEFREGVMVVSDRERILYELVLRLERRLWEVERKVGAVYEVDLEELRMMADLRRLYGFGGGGVVK